MKCKTKLLVKAVVILTALFNCNNFVNCRRQIFRESPANTTVFEGDIAILNCKVNDVAGNVQWSQNGLMLGYNLVVPGFDGRYCYIVNSAFGVFDLKISNASKEDGGFYECQVGPAKNNLPLRSGAFLTIIDKPQTATSITRAKEEDENDILNVRYLNIGKTSKKVLQNFKDDEELPVKRFFDTKEEAEEHHEGMLIYVLYAILTIILLFIFFICGCDLCIRKCSC